MINTDDSAERMEWFIFINDPFQAVTLKVFMSIYRFGRGISFNFGGSL